MKCQYCGKHSGTVSICSYECEQKLCDLFEETVTTVKRANGLTWKEEEE